MVLVVWRTVQDLPRVGAQWRWERTSGLCWVVALSLAAPIYCMLFGTPKDLNTEGRNVAFCDFILSRILPYFRCVHTIDADVMLFFRWSFSMTSTSALAFGCNMLNLLEEVWGAQQAPPSRDGVGSQEVTHP